MTPLKYYQQQIKSEHILEDKNQLAVMQVLDTIYHDLIRRQRQRSSQVGKLRRKVKPRFPIKGLYLYGTVGIGKTFLIDTFYHCLPVKKMRIHFHAFMQQIHEELRKQQGHKNPLQRIAKQIADEHLVICFDEFFVSNIADAMILGELFKALFKGGICLVTTSNIAPDELYKNGIQRERFLPAIEVIKANVRTIHLESKEDYRLRHIQQAGVYYTPLNETAKENLEHSFRHFSQCPNFSTDPIEILGRQIHIIKQAGDTIWFDFMDICGRPRSQNDYLELVKHYQSFLIANVPILDNVSRDLVVSFTNLIDVLYDNSKRVIISAEAPTNQLYTKPEYKIEFDRTTSRLIEMQSTDYFNSTPTQQNR